MPRTSNPKAMLSATDMSGNSARFWKMRAVGRLLGPMPRMSRPPMRTAPSEGSRKPETARRIVVLPHPEGPRKLKRSEEHTSELQSLMRISYAVFCLKKKKKTKLHIDTYHRNRP